MSSGDVSATQARAIRKWKFLFDSAYQADASAFSGWISSYSGRPIARPEMEEWLEGTVGRIFALRPRRVLEIGCGTGLIVRRVAPLVEHYCGVDISARAIEQLVASMGDAAAIDPGIDPGIDLRCAAAHEVASLFAPGFDLVILNSVIQYFTDSAYLDAVLAQVITLLLPGGALFVGDIRNAALADSFFASVALARAEPAATVEELRQSALALAAADGELQIAPQDVPRLVSRFPRVRAFDLLLKPGMSDNELTRFRYDAILHLDEAPAAPEVEPLRWSDLPDGMDGLERRLLGAPGRTLKVSGIGNARLGSALSARAHISGLPHLGDAPEQPAAFEALARRLGFAVSLMPGEDRPESFDALFAPASPAA